MQAATAPRRDSVTLAEIHCRATRLEERYARAVKFNPDEVVKYVSQTATRGLFRVRFSDGTETEVRAKTASEAKFKAAKTKGNRRMSPLSARSTSGKG